MSLVHHPLDTALTPLNQIIVQLFSSNAVFLLNLEWEWALLLCFAHYIKCIWQCRLRWPREWPRSITIQFLFLPKFDVFQAKSFNNSLLRETHCNFGETSLASCGTTHKVVPGALLLHHTPTQSLEALTLLTRTKSPFFNTSLLSMDTFSKRYLRLPGTYYMYSSGDQDSWALPHHCRHKHVESDITSLLPYNTARPHLRSCATRSEKHWTYQVYQCTSPKIASTAAEHVACHHCAAIRGWKTKRKTNNKSWNQWAMEWQLKKKKKKILLIWFRQEWRFDWPTN